MHDNTKEKSTEPQLWLRKREAARRMSVTPRRVLALIKEAPLQCRIVKDPRTRQNTKEVLAADCDAYVASFRRPAGVVVETAQPELPEVREQLPPAPDLVRLLDALAPMFERLLPTPNQGRLWLTLDEGASYSGLSATILLRLIHRSVLPALSDEPATRQRDRANGERAHRGSSWRIRRVDLDALAGYPRGNFRHTPAPLPIDAIL